MNRQRLTTLAVTLAFVATAAPTALAGGGPSSDQYPTGKVLVAKVTVKAKPHKAATHAAAPAATVKTTGTLPFTGLDLGLLAGAGALALAGGVGLRKLGYKRNNGA